MAWPWSEMEMGREGLHRKRDRDTEFEEEEEEEADRDGDGDGDGDGACCAVLLVDGINKPDLVVPHYPYPLLCSLLGRQWAGPIHFYLAHGLGIDWIFSQ